MKGLITIQDAVISLIKRIKDANRIYKIIAFTVLSVILILVSVFCSGVKLTYNIKYNDKVFANVASKAVFDEGMLLAHEALADSSAEIADVELEAVVSVNANSVSADEVSQLILSNSPSVVSGYKITSGENTLAYVEDIKVFDDAKTKHLKKFDIKGANCESSFIEELSVTPVYFHSEKLTSNQDVETAISKLDVKTVAVSTTVSSIRYNSVTKKDSSKSAGYIAVLSKGVSGSRKTVTTTTYVNGVAESEPHVSSVVLKNPTNEVIVVGTKNVYITSAPQNASSSGFKWPLGVKGVVTSDYGPRNGKTHKGVDIGVPEGTSVIAVKGGTVIAEAYNESYGYYVLIDHGNGLKTRYAHNKRNVVNVGQYVSAGQLIALSGNTGRSTGPHLHFEVIINGDHVDPGNYLALP